jgi:hypothetical protein
MTQNHESSTEAKRSEASSSQSYVLVAEDLRQS